MQTIVVKGSSQLESIITQLSNYNGQFQSKVEELAGEQKSLDGMWDGEANEAFNTNFNDDKKQFDTFHSEVEKYVQQLRVIKENYEKAEEKSRQIAAERKNR